MSDAQGSRIVGRAARFRATTRFGQLETSGTAPFRPTRREFLAGVGGLLVLGAAGCGGGGEGGGESASGPARTIEHKYGNTRVPGAPERVVSVGYSDQDPILALGVVPVAVRYWFDSKENAIFPWAKDEAGGETPEVLDMPEQLNFERIAALEPDIIIGTYSGMTREDYDTLSEIAPTIPQSGDYIDYGMPWQEATISIGRALNREDRAEELVAGVEEQFAALREEHLRFEGAVLAGASYTSSSEIGFFASEDPRTRFFTLLGFETPDELDEIAGDQFYGTISGERLDLLDQDVLVWSQLSYTDGGREKIESDQLVQQMDASQEGRMVFVDGDVDDALQFNTVLSIPYALDAIVPQLANAIDGDPDTGSTTVE